MLRECVPGTQKTRNGRIRVFGARSCSQRCLNLALPCHASRFVFTRRASWAASNIVLVETTPIDGTFRVIESWKGDLSAGSQLVIPELIPAANALPISAYPKWTSAAPSAVLGRFRDNQPVHASFSF